MAALLSEEKSLKDELATHQQLTNRLLLSSSRRSYHMAFYYTCLSGNFYSGQNDLFSLGFLGNAVMMCFLPTFPYCPYVIHRSQVTCTPYLLPLSYSVYPSCPLIFGTPPSLLKYYSVYTQQWKRHWRYSSFSFTPIDLDQSVTLQLYHSTSRTPAIPCPPLKLSVLHISSGGGLSSSLSDQ